MKARRARPARALLRAVHARALRGAHAQVPGVAVCSLLDVQPVACFPAVKTPSG